MDSTLLYFTLACAIVSFSCAAYTTLRTLLPLLPDHPLQRRHRQPPDFASSEPQRSNLETRPKLKSAQRFTVYLALTDVFVTCVLLWEVACATSPSSQLGRSRLSDSRIYLVTTARPTLLLIVAVLSYTNVIRGRSISLGFADCIVWVPALVCYAVGAGLASLAVVDSPKVWLGLLAWLSTTTLMVSFCFARLLVAILRVRSSTRRDQACSSSEQEKSRQEASEHDLPYQQRYSLNFPNFSGLTSNFVDGIGRSSQGPAHDIIDLSCSNRNSNAWDRSRLSQDVLETYDSRSEFRSPTPGSTYGLLYRSTNTVAAQDISRSRTPPNGMSRDRDVLGAEQVRHSISASIASRASTYFAAGGFIGGSTVRQAVIKEAWKDQDPPGTGHAPKVELSDREARGAIIRLGGHLASTVLGFALVSPLVCLRATRSSMTAIPTVASYLFVAGVCQPSIVLAYQCWATEGFWFRKPSPPSVTSSSAIEFDGVETVPTGAMESRSTSRTSTWKDCLPGIRPDGEDCDAKRKGRVGRALSVLSAHPKLQILDDGADSVAAASGFEKSAMPSGHTRLRSLKLSKGTIATMCDYLPARPRAGSSASRKTVGGFEHGRNWSTPVNDFDKAIAMHLLASRSKTPDSSRAQETSATSDRTRSQKLSPSVPPTPAPTSLSQAFDFSIREVSISPASSIFPTTPPRESTRPISIDYLSAHVLPSLVPSLRIGRDLEITSSSDPIAAPPRPTSFRSTRARARVARSCSLPLATNGCREQNLDRGAQTDSEVWLAVSDEAATAQKENRDGSDDVQSQLGLALAEIEPISNATLINHERSGSSATRLDISFDWEAVDETEILDLDNGAVADESSTAEEDEGNERRAISRHRNSNPFSPILAFAPVLPLSLARRTRGTPDVLSSPEGSVVHKGSNVSLGDEEDDVHTSTIQCASVRPVVRKHGQTDSIGSTLSLSDLNHSSITSQGFKHLLNSAGASWHTSTTGATNDPASSDDARHRASLPRRALPTPPSPLQPGLRPLSLLGQRDPNCFPTMSSSDRETEMLKATRYHLARSAEPSSSTRPPIPLPPLPTTAEELDLISNSRTPTPKSRRALAARQTEESAHATPKAPSRTPPNVTRRKLKSKARDQANAARTSTNDSENVQVEVEKLSSAKRSARASRAAPAHKTRNMR
ncbi:hypothetical protein JCM11491_004760 [Sporobolomyces phaffii]